MWDAAQDPSTQQCRPNPMEVAGPDSWPSTDYVGLSRSTGLSKLSPIHDPNLEPYITTMKGYLTKSVVSSSHPSELSAKSGQLQQVSWIMASSRSITEKIPVINTRSILPVPLRNTVFEAPHISQLIDSTGLSRCRFAACKHSNTSGQCTVSDDVGQANYDRRTSLVAE